MQSSVTSVPKPAVRAAEAPRSTPAKEPEPPKTVSEPQSLPWEDDTPEMPPPPVEAPPETMTLPEIEPEMPTVTPSVPESASSGDWQSFLDSVIESIPIGMRFILTDPNQVQGEFSGSELVLRVADGFARNTINSPELINKLRTEASRLRGESVQIRIESLKAAVSLHSDKLTALEQFGNVTFR